jgi:hypothetical protein
VIRRYRFAVAALSPEQSATIRSAPGAVVDEDDGVWLVVRFPDAVQGDAFDSSLPASPYDAGWV